MHFTDLFAGFFAPVVIGSATVLILIGLVRLRTPRRSPALVARKPSR